MVNMELVVIFGYIGYIGWVLLILVGVFIWKMNSKKNQMMGGLNEVMEQMQAGLDNSGQKKENEEKKQNEEQKVRDRLAALGYMDEEKDDNSNGDSNEKKRNK